MCLGPNVGTSRSCHEQSYDASSMAKSSTDTNLLADDAAEALDDSNCKHDSCCVTTLFVTDNQHASCPKRMCSPHAIICDQHASSSKTSCDTSLLRQPMFAKVNFAMCP
ncbi:TPA: hypothetical protein ACH3X1_010033 [Trebouxia sp. C0004]